VPVLVPWVQALPLVLLVLVLVLPPLVLPPLGLPAHQLLQPNYRQQQR
tara:strand:- start:5 stop:148 length:144 start_codon:yes stop_codon:yes gene_type:complete